MMSLCMKCGKPLEADEIAVHKKLVNRGATEFLCIRCLAEHFCCTREMIEERIEHFKKTGCALFGQSGS